MTAWSDPGSVLYMAAWVIVRDTRGVALYYDNLLRGTRECLGHLHRGNTDTDIVNWIKKEGKPTLGDTIVLSDGRYFSYMGVVFN